MRYCFLSLLLIFSYAGHAQKLKFGGGGGYAYGQSQALDYPVDLYNFARPLFAMPHLRHGYYLTAQAAYGFTHKIFITPTFSYRYVESSASQNIYSFQAHVHFYEVLLRADFYFLAKAKRNNMVFPRTFYVYPLAGIGYAFPRVYQNGKAFSFDGQAYNARAVFPIVGGGIGYDVFLMDQLSLTPSLAFLYYFNFSTPDLDHALASSTLLSFAQQTYGMLNLKAGAVFRWHSKSLIRK